MLLSSYKLIRTAVWSMLGAWQSANPQHYRVLAGGRTPAVAGQPRRDGGAALVLREKRQRGERLEPLQRRALRRLVVGRQQHRPGDRQVAAGVLGRDAPAAVPLRLLQHPWPIMCSR